MKRKRIGFVITGCIAAVLLIAITVMLFKIYGGTSISIRKANHFLNELSEVGAIDKERLPEKDELKEITNMKDANKKYTVVGNSYGMDLDENYEVIGFLDQNIVVSKPSSIISENEAIKYAEKYLDKIINEKFRIKEIKGSTEDNLPYYTISFYKYHKRYMCLDYEILLNINKYNGSLVGYSGVNDEKLHYDSEVNIDAEKAKEIAKEYLNKLNIQGDFTYNYLLGYVNIGEGKNELAYYLKFQVNNNEKSQIYDMYINAKSGEIIRENIDLDIIEN